MRHFQVVGDTGEYIDQLEDILIDSNDKNWLWGDINNIPSCFINAKVELIYAGFSSTHVTVHLPIKLLTDDKRKNAKILADFYWYLLRLACQFECEGFHNHAFLQNGEYPYYPDMDISVRDALVRWGDPCSAHLLETIHKSSSWSYQELLEKFYEIFGQEPTTSFLANDFDAYTCRPRIVNEIMLFEMRCFHSAIKLSSIKHLVEAASQFNLV